MNIYLYLNSYKLPVYIMETACPVKGIWFYWPYRNE
jgi:hypothetical protein